MGAPVSFQFASGWNCYQSVPLVRKCKENATFPSMFKKRVQLCFCNKLCKILLHYWLHYQKELDKCLFSPSHSPFLLRVSFNF
jgi:hypothetical protein